MLRPKSVPSNILAMQTSANPVQVLSCSVCSTSTMTIGVGTLMKEIAPWTKSNHTLNVCKKRL
eukprot:1263772-Amphidinium_carterae.1